MDTQAKAFPKAAQKCAMVEVNLPTKPFSRRDFLKLSEAISIGLLLSACGLEATATEPAAAVDPPGPASTQISTVTPAPGCFTQITQNTVVPGQRYLARVPDTLDLLENAKLAINALTRCINPDQRVESYFYGNAARNPPVLSLPGVNSKFFEGLSLLRYMTGSDFNTEVDRCWREYFLEMFQKDAIGLTFTDARFICWAAHNSQQEQNSCWREIAEAAIGRLSDILTHENDYCYLTDSQGKMHTGWEATQEGWTLQGVTSVYSITGSRAARKLADELARYLKDHAQIFDANGHFLARHESENGPALHFHHNGNAMTALSEYALATHNQEFAAFAQKGYEYARSAGWPLVGFFPEYIQDWPDARPYIDCETCATVDMIMMAVNLSKLGQGDYWDDVDRYVRNQFTEMQMKRGDWINLVAENYPAIPVGDGEDGNQVAERVAGSFAGWASANDYCANPETPIVSGCCTGNGARAIFHVWKNMLAWDDGTLRLHLLFNRASPWADINSYVPCAGQVDIALKTACQVEIRIPEWVKADEVSCFINDAPGEHSVQGRYVRVGPVQPGNVVSMKFPIAERTVTTAIAGCSYRLILKGNEVVAIDPPGQWHPFYQRAHYRAALRWTDRERFVPAAEQL
ncbi:MAG: glycoside hydrolase family 127 protein [Anaerolineales bacterium]|nr:glycoside hydrolase family 127 protein [Anaerolineales bacterium]